MLRISAGWSDNERRLLIHEHDVPNLFVTDGACMASSAHHNPSLPSFRQNPLRPNV